ncbi:hypothetical protein [Actinoplanes sp. NBRC 103695]|uniref:hypothetical protein n=1 Tax=Actinoplanes sp. NBRC 103695 TaxID=3032202 RepID=UPI0024A3DDD9|nr:hypothetical protein [Actinoplanes sp. NBRC 103695]GLZ02124.1 hypothetical protein Acsp02_93750 [Actinoplanes sp. NBRC 103695]
MITVVSGSKAAPDGTLLVSRSATGADVLAQVPHRSAGAGHERPWRDALQHLSASTGKLTADDHFQWILTVTDHVIAQSPPVYRDEQSCRRAFTDAQYAAGLALGARPHPSASQQPQDGGRQ